jgi:hypothetical protein
MPDGRGKRITPILGCCIKTLKEDENIKWYILKSSLKDLKRCLFAGGNPGWPEDTTDSDLELPDITILPRGGPPTMN